MQDSHISVSPAREDGRPRTALHKSGLLVTVSVAVCSVGVRLRGKSFPASSRVRSSLTRFRMHGVQFGSHNSKRFAQHGCHRGSEQMMWQKVVFHRSIRVCVHTERVGFDARVEEGVDCNTFSSCKLAKNAFVSVWSEWGQGWGADQRRPFATRHERYP